MNPDKMRENYEKFIKTQPIVTRFKAPLDRYPLSGNYKDARIQSFWNVWQYASEQFL